MTLSPRSRIFSVLVYAAFFASGAASLIAEVTWNRMLIVMVGNSMSATAMIVVIFMGGLGLGSHVGGRVLGKRRRSLVPYLLLEMTIGLYVLLSPALFEFLAQGFATLAESFDNRAGLTLVRLVVSTAALLLPAFLMGATFPAMVNGAAPDSPSRRTARTGYLYSLNTLGAAVGCFAAGVHLLYEFGVQTTLIVAFGLYLAAAFTALLANGLLDRRPAVDEPERAVDRSEPGVKVGLRRFLYVATFCIGFVSLAYEVLLTRLTILYLGNTVSVFALVLTAFLLGTGISAVAGTWLYGFLGRRPVGADRLFGFLALAAGAFVMLTPYLLLTDLVIGTERFARFADAAPTNPFAVLGVIVLPTILMGALLPVAIRMLEPAGRAEATRGAATLYALNTAGGLLGAGIANHYLVPLVGIQHTILFLVSVCLVVGFVNLLSPGTRPLRWAFAALCVAVPVGVLATAPPRMMDLYAGKLAESTRAGETEVLLVHEGRAATVTVLDQMDPKAGTYRDMYLNGVEEASTRFWHTQLFKLLGILPVLVHESDTPKEVLVIAFGAGITAGSVLASDEVSSLDVVDLNPDIEGINDLFTDVNGDVFHKPRFHFHNDDGRSYLVTSSKRYDLIIGDSTHPRAYDSWILYTEEFYRAAKRRLRPGGIFAQWVPVLGSMRGDLFKIHLNTFRSVFPHSTFWYVYGSDQAFLLATPEPFFLDAERLQQKLDRLPGWFRSEEYQIDAVARVAGFFWMDEAAMTRMIGDETRRNTDDFHYIDKQSAVWPAPPSRQLPAYQASLIPHLAGGETLHASIRKEQELALHLARFGFFRSKPDLYQAYCERPENGNVLFFMSLEFAGLLPELEEFCQAQAEQRFRMQLVQNPGNFIALNGLANVLARYGRLDEALSVAERAAALAPRNGMVLDTRGWILFQQGRYEEALKVLKESASLLPDHPVAHYHLGAAYHANGNNRMARKHLQKALSVSQDFEEADEARRLLARLG